MRNSSFLCTSFAWRWLGVSLLVACATPALSAAAAVPAEIKSATIGIDGHAKVGYWTPVHLEITAGTAPLRGQIVLEAPDGDGVPARFRHGASSRIAVPAGRTWHGWRYIKIGRVQCSVRVTVRDDAGQIVASTTVVRAPLSVATRPWVVVVGQNVGIREAANRLVRQRQKKLLISRLATAAGFPDRWYGYEGVDALLVCTSNMRPLDDLSTRQLQALRQWIELGGRLILSVGTNASRLFAGTSRFAEFRPGDFEEMNPYWKATGLEAFARSTTRLLNPDLVPSPVFINPRGRVLCYEGVVEGDDQPLILRYPYGFGHITCLALDLDRPPLARWAGRSHLLARLLQFGGEEDQGISETSGLGQVSHVGFEDLVGQLRGCLEQFDGITLVHFAWIAGILVVYLLLIGPLDYYLLRKWNRPQWTWATFTLLVVSFCVLAAVLARHWKGRQVLANQIDLVDIDVQSACVRGTTWVNLYSPDAVAADIGMAPVAPLGLAAEPQVLLSWQGLPGTGLGGMNTTGSVGQLNDQYTIYAERAAARESGPRIASLPIHSSSTKPIVSRWWARAGSPRAGTLTTSVDGFLHGEIVNPLDVDMEHCAVYFGNWSYRLDRHLGPGETADLDEVSPLDLKWQLSRRQLMNSKERARPWDRTDFTDIPRMMDMVMFHGAAGGRQFTHLGDRYQAFADLTGHLRMGRAILVGRSAKLASQLRTSGGRPLDAHTRHWTYYRIVIPVAHDVIR